MKKVLYLAIFISQLLCGLATVTSVSRMMFAFSRDGGLPFSKALATVAQEVSHAGGRDLGRVDPGGAVRAGAQWLEAAARRSTRSSCRAR